MDIRFNKTYMMAGLVGSIGITIVYMAHNKYYERIVSNHPTREFAIMALRLDPRIANFCGKRYQIKGYQYISQDDKTFTYRLRIEGIRGKCKVLVKTEKYSHTFLKEHSREQGGYAKKTKEEKAQTPFIPFDYNDVLIPTKETETRIKETLGEEDEKLLLFNKDDYLKGDYINYNKIKSIDLPIEGTDTFYRLASIVMVANDSLVFNVRPFGAKHRSYDIEDTTYDSNTLDEALRKIHDMRYKYNEVITDEFSKEEIRNELILQKQTNFQQRLAYRKYVMVFNCILIFAGTFILRIAMKDHVDGNTFRMLQSKIANFNLKPLGNNKRLICVNQVKGFDHSQLSGFILGENGKTAKIPISHKKAKSDETYVYEFKETDVKILDEDMIPNIPSGNINTHKIKI
jgi:hypothetical protein